jgi:hypothetical protein
LLTIHAADIVLHFPLGAVPLPRGAVAVDGVLIADVGRYEEVVARNPRARVRRWPGILMPGLFNQYGAALLESAYHPDPREADELGMQPLTGQALAALGMDGDRAEERWGASARRGLQRMLRHGTTALEGPFTRPAVRTAVGRSGLSVLQRQLGRPGGEPTFDVFAGEPLSAVVSSLLAVGSRADLAVFDVPVEVGPPTDLMNVLRKHGTAACVATVLGGRLVYRGR